MDRPARRDEDKGRAAPRVSPLPAAQAEVGRRRNGWGEREAEPNGPANQVTQEKGPHRGPLGLDHRDGGVGPALQLAG